MHTSIYIYLYINISFYDILQPQGLWDKNSTFHSVKPQGWPSRSTFLVTFCHSFQWGSAKDIFPQEILFFCLQWKNTLIQFRKIAMVAMAHLWLMLNLTSWKKCDFNRSFLMGLPTLTFRLRGNGAAGGHQCGRADVSKQKKETHW